LAGGGYVSAAIPCAVSSDYSLRRPCERSEAIQAQAVQHRRCSPGVCRGIACAWIASFLTMTKNRAAYYQHINEPFFFRLFPFFSRRSWGGISQMTTVFGFRDSPFIIF
jgi:hypothetical protein